MEKVKFFCVEVFDAFDPDKSVVVYASENQKSSQTVYDVLDALHIDVNWIERSVMID